ncbi:hypothetical protein DL768_004994 [Monosporascus sp. mg162]|nr:hypothetical protein DL768_004994 [Monosporascus sp. mg162]
MEPDARAAWATHCKVARDDTPAWPPGCERAAKRLCIQQPQQPCESTSYVASVSDCTSQEYEMQYGVLPIQPASIWPPIHGTMNASYVGITEMNTIPSAWGNDEMAFAMPQDIGVEEAVMSTPSDGSFLESAAFEPNAFARNITLASFQRDQYGTDDIFRAQDFTPQLAPHSDLPLDCEYQEPLTNENWEDAFLLARLPQALEPVAGISDTLTGLESDMNPSCDGATPVQNPPTEVLNQQSPKTDLSSSYKGSGGGNPAYDHMPRTSGSGGGHTMPAEPVRDCQRHTPPSNKAQDRCDACFGYVIMDLSVPPERVVTGRSAPLTMKRFGDAFMLHLVDSRKYVGILREPALIRVLQDYTVQLEAILVVSGPPLPQGKAKLKSKLPKIEPIHSVRIVVTGLKHEKSAVGNILSEAGLFLQHPSANEYDTQLEYCNPHYLLRPGGTMPDLQHFALDNPPGETHQLRTLNEAHKSRYMKLFDSANAEDVRMDAQASPRLKSVLMEHQQKALSMMVEKESGIVLQPSFPPLWEHIQASDGSNRQSWLVSGDAYSHAEIDHVHPGRLRVAVYHGSQKKDTSAQLRDSDIILTTYETMRSSWVAQDWLYQETWRRVVLDEGTPIHNSLDDYGALLSFIGVPSLAEKAQFDFWITSALKDQTPRYMQRLRDLIRATCLRRTKGTLSTSFNLPKPVEKVVSVVLHGDDRVLYEFFKNQASSFAANFTQKKPSGADAIGSGRNNILSLINFLRLICNHGEQLLPTAALRAWKARDATSIDWGTMQSSRKRCDLCHADIEESYNLGSGHSNANCVHLVREGCAVTYEDEFANVEASCPKFLATESYDNDSELACGANVFYRPSAKIEALLCNLSAERSIQQTCDGRRQAKSVIFTYWTKMLNLVEQALKKHGFNFKRMDGQTRLQDRAEALRLFKEDPECTIFLATIGSAGEGVNLTAATHVHLIEPHWNPMVEAQAVDRVHRMGQTRQVTVTRYIVPDSIETYMQWIQQEKLRLVSQSLESCDTPQADIDSRRWNR